MAEPPTDPDSDLDTGDGTDVEPDRKTTVISPWQKAVGILGLFVVLWVGSEMYDVVFFQGSGPSSGGTPVEDQDQDGDPAPPSDEPHDPSQFDH